MGAILAKFRKEKSTAEVLEGLEEKIRQIEKYTINTQEQKRRIVGNFLAISIGIYVIAFIIFYFVYFPPTWRKRIIYSVPLFLFPFVIILLRRVFTWYFERKLNKNSVKLTALHAEKKKILEQVMDKETYKVAVKLLARYGDKNSGQKSLYALTPRAPAAGSINATTQRLSIGHSPSGPATASSLQDLRLRQPFSSTTLATTPRQLAGVRSSPAATGTSTSIGGQTLLPRIPLPITPQRRPLDVNAGIVAGQELRRRTPFPIVNQHGKGVLERIVDVLIGDGPKDRFAMICKECYAHNGMALKEDFDYTTFRCAFCNALNPARKTRPIAPSLPEQQYSPLNRNINSSSSSESDNDSENDEPVGAMPTASTIATPRILLTDAPNITIKTATTMDISNTPVAVERQHEMGAGDAPSVAAEGVVYEKGQVDEVEEMEIENEDDPQSTPASARVVTNLQALHAAEAEELNRLQERFAKIYTTPLAEPTGESLLDGKEDNNIEERHLADNLDELKKIK
ncbi:endoplasmic reticulum junction formation protein lunapark-A [Eurosta solidaginis]|uniref:endoplasmic reticulum junction formation protein lunapark-A n=1 Tax=Eurosta solidaginis TaxID=178769 RepID=UPI003530788B